MDTVLLTTGEGDLRDSATEKKPPYQGKGETVIRAHRFLVTKNNGKPQLEQVK